jgi:acyl carrier protein
VPGGTLASRGTAEGEVLEFPLAVPEVEGLTHFETLVAALHALLASYGNAEVVTALDLSTRPAGLAGHIGCWVNELPLASRPAAETPFHAFATGLRADLREIYRHREVPLARAVPGLRPHAALAPVSVSYRRLSGERSPLGEVEWLAFNHAVRGALQLQVAEGADGARASLRFDPRELTDPRRFADDLARLLAAVGENPGRALGELVPFAPAVPAGTGTDATAAGTAAAGTAAGGTAAPVAAVPAAVPAADLAAAAPGDDPLVGRIRAIWEEILEYAPIGPDDDIFDLGGHSLTITQIIARMEQQLGLEISLDDFFDNPTIAGVMDVIRG